MLNIDAVSAYEDNYIWMLRSDTHAVAVDPGDAEPVLDYLRRHDLSLSAILVTHHHGDHTGGIPELLAAFPVPVYGPWRAAPPGACQPVKEGDTVELPEIGARFSVLDFPAHTRDHVGYLGHGVLFCGDTLFTCGFGRLFEGTPEQAIACLNKIQALPQDTHIYCAHEYTLSNIGFARKVEPDNPALPALEAMARQRLAENRPTIPTTLAQEMAANPFCRLEQSAVKAAAQRFAGHGLPSPVDVFAALRRWRESP